MMRLHFAAMVAAFFAVASAVAQSTGGGSVPAEIGNRANGRDYQPTPSEIIPREQAAGIRPPATQEKATDQLLERMDKNLLRDEGLSTKSVPKMTTGP
jgi:hypothetical protein